MYHEHLAKVIDERPWLWATHVWNMFDFGCDARDEGGVKGRNNKGLMTLDRKIRKELFTCTRHTGATKNLYTCAAAAMPSALAKKPR